MATKCYLGDSVYIERGPWGIEIVLTTDNGLGPSNTITLEPETYGNLVRYMETLTHTHDLETISGNETER